ncbi:MULTISPECIES: hypothetical protein [Protofrankia]|uniref:hypothetical protein n=1 Tax=Protofrankia TaxID=2994361 RepID=UPI000A86102F|nr:MULTISPECIES: hypothetical protein [Protofrankia]
MATCPVGSGVGESALNAVPNAEPNAEPNMVGHGSEQLTITAAAGGPAGRPIA